MTTCDCLDLVDAKLAESGLNTRLDVALFISGAAPKASVATCIPFWVKKKRGEKVMRVVAAYCPFCGVKYDEEEAR